MHILCLIINMLYMLSANTLTCLRLLTSFALRPTLTPASLSNALFIMCKQMNPITF